MSIYLFNPRETLTTLKYCEWILDTTPRAVTFCYRYTNNKWHCHLKNTDISFGIIPEFEDNCSIYPQKVRGEIYEVITDHEISLITNWLGCSDLNGIVFETTQTGIGQARKVFKDKQELDISEYDLW